MVLAKKHILDIFDLKILKAIEKKEKPILKYSKSLKLTNTTIRFRMKLMVEKGLIKVKEEKRKVGFSQKIPSITSKGKRVIKFVEKNLI